MRSRLRLATSALLCLSIAGCGEQGEQGDPTPGGGLYAEMLANAATRECRAKASAPGAGNEAQLQLICDCTRDRIIAAQPGPFEDEESRRAKLTGALDACLEEIGASSTG
jgi:hypothetical protein